jgi:hypothetical protein
VRRPSLQDIYAGIEFAAGSKGAGELYEFLKAHKVAKNVRFPASSGYGIKPISGEGSTRLVKAAIEYALTQNRKSVAIVHKGNIMKFTEGAFRDYGYSVAVKEYRDKVVTERESWILDNIDRNPGMFRWCWLCGGWVAQRSAAQMSHIAARVAVPGRYQHRGERQAGGAGLRHDDAEAAEGPAGGGHGRRDVHWQVARPGQVEEAAARQGHDRRHHAAAGAHACQGVRRHCHDELERRLPEVRVLLLRRLLNVLSV